MTAQLTPGAVFPDLTLNIAGDGTLKLPADLDSTYTVVLFYRGHWWPFCRRLLAGYEERLDDFKALEINIVAGTVDSEEKTLEVAEPLSFPVAYGMTRADGDAIGAWWEERRDHIQPSEFILRGNRVMASTYSNSPVGRMDPAETLTLIGFIDSMAKKKQG